jgi:UDP-N-acetylmuramate--alanine ligase
VEYIGMKLYFSGIGGSGIGPLAHLCLDAGYDVTGSTNTTSPVSDELAKRNVTVYSPELSEYLVKENNIESIDYFVYSSASGAGHEDYETAKSLGIKTVKRDEIINLLLKQKNLKMLAIAGTHGKTTMTGMMVWVMQKIGLDISYSVGSTLSFGPAARYVDGSEYFVYEADEFDRNFLHYKPFASIIANVDYDHPDSYKSEEEYIKAFNEFADNTTGVLFLHLYLLEIIHRRENIITGAVEAGKFLQQMRSMGVLGHYNRLNAMLVHNLLVNILGEKHSSNIKKYLATFPGTARRQEKITERIYSDYAHHPTEIKATLELFSEISKNVVVVYQPHQNRRQHLVLEQYHNAFEESKAVYWLPTYLTREDNNQRVLEFEDFAKVINNAALHKANMDEELMHNLMKEYNKGAIILFLGAGTINTFATAVAGSQRDNC